jgi:phage shock protein C
MANPIWRDLESDPATTGAGDRRTDQRDNQEGKMKKRFYLDRANGKIFGVCSGIARHMGWDPTFVRVGVVLVTLLGAFPWTLIAYGAAAMIAKKRPAGDEGDEAPVRAARMSTCEMIRSMRDIDRRMAEVETYVTAQNTGLAREIESLR